MAMKCQKDMSKERDEGDVTGIKINVRTVSIVRDFIK